MRLVVETLSGERGGETIFAGVSFALGPGEALLVTGPNGAGKTTLMRVIAGLLPAATGTIRFEGGGEAFPDVASALHFLGPVNAMKAALTVRENLEFWQSLAGPRHFQVGDALDLVDLRRTADLPFGYLSTGQKRRIAIARLFLNYRPFWLLDEPTSGLDADSTAALAHFMREHLGDGGMIVASTHLPLGLDDAQTLEMGG